MTRRRGGPARVTMTDVARLAVVSPSTVSLFLRDPAHVSPKLRPRIQEAIDSLGYVPNLMAGALAGARPRVVGVVVPSLVNSFFADTVTAMQTRMLAEDVQLLIGHSNYDDATEERLVRTFLAWSPAAMVLTGLHHGRATHRMLAGTEQPVVEIWELGPNPIDMLVGFSHADVGRAQTRHLIAEGCRDIAFVGARLGRDRRAAQRSRGYEDTLASHSGLAPPMVIDAGPQGSTEAAACAFVELLSRRPRLDGIVFSNDLLALGALFEAGRRGVAIPEQVAVIGFGDLDFGKSSLPRLSTVRPPGREIGARTAELVLGRAAGRPGLPEMTDLGFELVARESSARAPRAADQGGPPVPRAADRA
jgi:LacI family transcriptional regulator, gluconate utilization system Gnt-I transcriptional repressor